MLCRGWVTSCFNNKNVISRTRTSTVCHCVYGFICTRFQSILRENTLIVLMPKKKLSMGSRGWVCGLVCYWCCNQSSSKGGGGGGGAGLALDSGAASAQGRRSLLPSPASTASVQWLPEDGEVCSGDATERGIRGLHAARPGCDVAFGLSSSHGRCGPPSGILRLAWQPLQGPCWLLPEFRTCPSPPHPVPTGQSLNDSSWWLIATLPSRQNSYCLGTVIFLQIAGTQ